MKPHGRGGALLEAGTPPMYKHPDNLHEAKALGAQDTTVSRKAAVSGSVHVHAHSPRRQHPIFGAVILSLIFAGFWVGVFALIGALSAHPLALSTADLAIVALVLVGCVWALIVSRWHR